jgi:methionine synthase I (cobalamin-dependent)
VSGFLEALHSGRVLLMDGAMGTELQRAGLDLGEHHDGPARSKAVRTIHDRYVEAGAGVLLTSTFLFGSRPSRLARFSPAERLDAINAPLVRLAREAAGPRCFVLADIGPLLDPHGQMEFPDYTMLGPLLASLGDADGFLFETCSTPRSLTAVQYAFHRTFETASLPLLLSLTYHRSSSGRLVTFSGHAPETYARHAERHGVAALGVNCGRDIGMEDISEIVRRYRRETDLPLFARPNAGTPRQEDERWIYPHTPEAMAARLPELLEAGVSMIGGCCGTTPEHIAAFRPIVHAWNRSRPRGSASRR